MDLSLIDDLARRQHGLVSRRQEMELLTRGEFDGLVAKGVLIGIRRGVYRMAGTPPSWTQDLAGALLRRPDAVASHASAATLWQLEPGWPSPLIEITVPVSSFNRLPGATVHRAQLRTGEVTTVAGLAVTNAARTIIDLGAIATVGRIEMALDDALRRRLTTLGAVTGCLDANRRSGPPRLHRVDEVVMARMEQRTESPLERQVLSGLRRAGLPAPLAQHTVTYRSAAYRIDFAWPTIKVGIEVNSFAFHSTRTAFDADARKITALAAAGWVVIPVTSRSDLNELVKCVSDRLRSAA